MIELLDNIIDYAISRKATDIHLKANEYPTIRVNTQIELLDTTQKITKDMMIMIYQILKVLEEKKVISIIE